MTDGVRRVVPPVTAKSGCVRRSGPNMNGKRQQPLRVYCRRRRLDFVLSAVVRPVVGPLHAGVHRNNRASDRGYGAGAVMAVHPPPFLMTFKLYVGLNEEKNNELRGWSPQEAATPTAIKRF